MKTTSTVSSVRRFYGVEACTKSGGESVREFPVAIHRYLNVRKRFVNHFHFPPFYTSLLVALHPRIFVTTCLIINSVSLILLICMEWFADLASDHT